MNKYKIIYDNVFKERHYTEVDAVTDAHARAKFNEYCPAVTIVSVSLINEDKSINKDLNEDMLMDFNISMQNAGIYD